MHSFMKMTGLGACDSKWYGRRDQLFFKYWPLDVLGS